MKISDGIINTVELAVAATATISAGGVIAVGGGVLASLAGGAVLVNCVKREFKGDYQRQIKATCKKVERDKRIIARVKDVDQQTVTDILDQLNEIILDTGIDAEDFSRWDLDPKTVAQRLLERLAQKNKLFKEDDFARAFAQDVLHSAFDAVRQSEAFYRDTKVYVAAEQLKRLSRIEDKADSIKETGEDTNALAQKILAGMEALNGTIPDAQTEASITDTIKGLLNAGEGARKRAGEKLAEGNTDGARSALRQLAAQQEGAVVDAAQTWLDIGNLAYMNDTQEALEAFTRVTQLTPNNPNGWNGLGLLLYRTGDLTDAKDAYGKVLALGEGMNDKMLHAVAYGNLGIVEQNRGNMPGACAYWRQAYDLFAQIGAVPMVERVGGWLRDAGCENAPEE